MLLCLVLLVIPAAGTVPLAGPVCYWGKDPSHAATLLWLRKNGQETPSAPPLRVRESGTEQWKVVVAGTEPLPGSKHSIHRALLAGLESDTTYEISTGDMEPVRRLRTAPARFKPGMVFVTGGDMYQDRKRLDAMNARCGLEDPLFALLGGDLAYTNNTASDRWIDWMDSWAKLAVAPDGRLIPMVVAIGNHEVVGNGYKPADPPPPSQASQFYALFHPEGGPAHATRDFGNYLSLVLLDSGHTAPIAGQTKWLDQTLAARAGVPRVFACYHRPAWGTGVKDDASDIKKEWCPLFEKYRIDAVFENDHHDLKRTLPLSGGKIDEDNGVPYVGDGAWGVPPRTLDKKQLAKRPWLAKAASLNHFWRVVLHEDRIRFEAHTADGQVLDRFDRPLRRGQR